MRTKDSGEISKIDHNNYEDYLVYLQQIKTKIKLFLNCLYVCGNGIYLILLVREATILDRLTQSHSKTPLDYHFNY